MGMLGFISNFFWPVSGRDDRDPSGPNKTHPVRDDYGNVIARRDGSSDDPSYRNADGSYIETTEPPPRPPIRDRAYYQRWNRVLNDMVTQLHEGRRYLLDPSFALKRDEQFLEKIWHEPSIAKAIMHRQIVVAGGDWYLEPGDDDSKPLVPIFERALKGISRFSSETLFHLSRAFLSGSEFAKIQARYELVDLAKTGQPLQWWLPKRIRPMARERWHREWRVIDKDGDQRRHYYWAIYNPYKRQAEIIPPLEWDSYVLHIYYDEEKRLGYGWGLAETVAVYWEIKQTLLKYLVQGMERFGWPWTVFKTDEESEPVSANLGVDFERDRQIMDRLRKMRNLGSIKIDRDDDVQFLDAGERSAVSFIQVLDYIDNVMAGVIAGGGASLGGHGSREGGGSYASDAIEDDTGQAYMTGYDRPALEETVNEQVIGRIWRFNRANFEFLGMGDMAPPIFHLGRKKRDNPLQSLQEVMSMVQIGLNPIASEAWERIGWTKPDDADETIQIGQPMTDQSSQADYQQVQGQPGVATGPAGTVWVRRPDLPSGGFWRHPPGLGALPAGTPEMATPATGFREPTWEESYQRFCEWADRG